MGREEKIRISEVLYKSTAMKEKNSMRIKDDKKVTKVHPHKLRPRLAAKTPITEQIQNHKIKKQITIAQTLLLSIILILNLCNPWKCIIKKEVGCCPRLSGIAKHLHIHRQTTHPIW